MSPTKLLPNALGILSVFYVIMKMEGEPCTPKNFFRAFTVSSSPANKHFYHFQPRRNYRMLHLFTSSYGLTWWSKYVYPRLPRTAEGHIQHWGVPLFWRKDPFPNRRLKEPIPNWMKNYYMLDEEHNWFPYKFLVQPITWLLGLTSTPVYCAGNYSMGVSTVFLQVIPLE